MNRYTGHRILTKEEAQKLLFLGYDCNRITERLYIGAQINTDKDFETIKSLGITHIIDAQQERDDNAFEPKNMTGLTILWNPTPDDGVHPKPVSWVKNAVDFGMDALSHRGNIVLCHCAAGVNRGPSLGYAILRVLGLSKELAESLIRKNRPFVGLAYKDDVDAALVTLGWTK